MTAQGLRINDELELGEAELEFQADRSGGPGGQHVNKVSTRVSVLFDVAASSSLTEFQRDRILARLGSRISRAGVLRVTSQKFRSQSANREAARQRLADLVAWALTDRPERKPTRPTRASRRRRLEEKQRVGRRKADRGRVSVPAEEGS